MRTGETFECEMSFVVNPDPAEPLLKVGDIVTVGDAMAPYRVTAYAYEHGVQSFQLEPVQASAQGDGAGE